MSSEKHGHPCLDNECTHLSPEACFESMWDEQKTLREEIAAAKEKLGRAAFIFNTMPKNPKLGDWNWPSLAKEFAANATTNIPAAGSRPKCRWETYSPPGHPGPCGPGCAVAESA